MKKDKTKKVNKFLKREFKRYEKAKKRCAKSYPDWKDDEFNCLDLKYIWGLDINDKTKDTSFDSLNKATLYFNRLINKYELCIDLTDISSKEFVEYLGNIFNHIWLDPRFYTSDIQPQGYNGTLPPNFHFEIIGDSMFMNANTMFALLKNLYTVIESLND